MPKEDKDFLERAEEEKLELEESMKESFRQRDERIRAEHIRKLEAEVGNLFKILLSPRIFTPFFSIISSE